MKDISESTALVTGASRGLGRGIAAALSAAGAHVVAVARDGDRLAELPAKLGGSVTPVTGASPDTRAFLLSGSGLAPITD